MSQFHIEYGEKEAKLMFDDKVMKVVTAQGIIDKAEAANVLLFWLRNEQARFHDATVKGFQP